MAQRPRRQVRFDPHPAYRVDRAGRIAGVKADLEQLDRCCDVMQPVGSKPGYLETGIAGSAGNAGGDQDLAAASVPGDPGGQVDRGAEIVAVSADRRAVVRPGAGKQKPGCLAAPFPQPGPGSDGRGGCPAGPHDAVAAGIYPLLSGPERPAG